MRLLPVLVLVAACGSKQTSKPQPVELASLVSDDAIGVLRQPGDQFSVLLYARDVAKDNGQVAACWTKLEQRVVAGYQVSVPRSSYFLLEGDLPKAEVESCVASATQDLVKSDGAADIAAFTTPGGTVHAAWRGQYVVLGNREQVERAVKPAQDTVARWRTLLATAPQGAPVWTFRTDHAFDDLVGGPTASFLLAIDKLEGPPKSVLEGRVVVRYQSDADATKGEQFVKDWIARGKFPRETQGPAEAVALYDQLATALQKARVTRNAATLEIAFDSTTFGGMAAQFAAAAASLGAN